MTTHDVDIPHIAKKQLFNGNDVCAMIMLFKSIIINVYLEGVKVTEIKIRYNFSEM